MMENWINILLLILFTLALFFIVIPQSRKWISIAYVVAVVLVFCISIQFNSLLFSLSKLITGVMTIVILNMSPHDRGVTFFGSHRTGWIFRGMTLLFGLVLVLFISSNLSRFLSVSYIQTTAALFLVVCGFVQVGISVRTFRIFLGLLSIFQGFEIIYGTIEQSIFINGLISVIDLLIALVGSYLLNQLQEVESK